MKYVIARDESAYMIGTPKWPKGGQTCGPEHHDQVLVFSDDIMHAVAFEQLRKAYPGLRAVSAGFVCIAPAGVHCYGRSESMNLGPRAEIDAHEIANQISAAVRPIVDAAREAEERASAQTP